MSHKVWTWVSAGIRKTKFPDFCEIFELAIKRTLWKSIWKMWTIFWSYLRDHKIGSTVKKWKVHLAYPASLQALHSNTWKQIMPQQHNRINNPNWQEATSWLFASVAKDLNSGLPRTIPTSCQSGTQTLDHQILIPMRWPPGHAASL